MGLFDFLFKNRPYKDTGRWNAPREEAFRMLNGYVPKFTSWEGGLYESELIRSAIWAKANHISKLDVEVYGSAKPALQNKLKHGPNTFQTWGQFLARASVILDVHNTCLICPIYDEYGQPSGYFTPLPRKCEVVQVEGVPYLRYEFAKGERAAIEMDACGVLVKHQYKSDFFGETNQALYPTVDLIHMQDQAIKEGVKSAATYRFMGQLNNFAKAEDVAKERKRFTEENFTASSGGGGLLLFPNTYTNIKQIEAKPWVVDAEQMAIIKNNVFDYFGVSEDALQGKLVGDSWNAFYESAIEPFAVQFSSVMTKAIFTFREQSEGNRVFASSNRLQYMTNADKLNVTSQMADRGLMTRNELREIWNLAPLPEPYGSQIPARGEYYSITDETGEENNGGEE